MLRTPVRPNKARATWSLGLGPLTACIPHGGGVEEGDVRVRGWQLVSRKGCLMYRHDPVWESLRTWREEIFSSPTSLMDMLALIRAHVYGGNSSRLLRTIASNVGQGWGIVFGGNRRWVGLTAEREEL